MFLGKLWLRIKGEILTLKEDLEAPRSFPSEHENDDRPREAWERPSSSSEVSPLRPAVDYGQRTPEQRSKPSEATPVPTRRSLGGVEAPPGPGANDPDRDPADTEGDGETGNRRVLG